MISPSLSFLLLWLLQAQPGGAPRTGSLFGEYILNPFVLSILVFFILSSIRLILYLSKLPAQHAALEQVTDNYREVERKQETDPELIKRDLLEQVDPDSIPAHRVVELQRISVRGGDFDQVALAEVLAAREGAKVSIARYVASVLVLLGLCGAIYGLSGLVVNMGPALKNVQEQLDKGTAATNSGAARTDGNKADNNSAVQASFSALVQTMSDSLTNTRSAFFASLTGILTSVILLLCNWYVSWRQINFLAALEDLTATKLIPIFKPLQEASQLAEVVEAFREGSTYMVRLSDELDGKVSQVGTSLENLFAIVRKFGEGADALRGHQDRVYQAQEQMMGVVTQFMGLTSRIEAHQAGAHVDIAGVVQAVNESNKNLARALEDWQARHEDLLQSIERGAKQAHAETKDARDLSQKGITEVAGLIHTSVDQQVGLLRAQAMELLQQQQVGTGNHLRELLDRQAEFVSELQKSVSESDGHKEMLAGLTSTMEQERKTFSERMEKILRQNEQNLKAMLAEQKQLLDTSGMRRVEEGLVKFVSDSRADFNALMERQEGFGKNFGELSQVAGRLGGMLRMLIGVAVVTIPVFAALGIMYIFDLRPQDQIMRIGSMAVIVAMIFSLAWFLRAKT
jgi:ABC-type multidrug transport system fused ATPase/permease subunit